MIRLKTAAIMASIMVTTTVTACAGDLTAVRVSDYDGASRIVFDMTELPLSWTKSYNANQNTVTLNLANTTNKISNAADRTTHKIGVLKGMSFQPTNDGLQVRLSANQSINYHAFTLSNPNRVVVDLFSDYSQKTTKSVGASIQTANIKTAVNEGLIHAYAYSVSASGEVDLNRIQSVGVLRYTPSRGYFIEEKKPLLQAKTPKSTLVITTVNGPRRNNALTLYTSSFGESTNTNGFGYEVTVSNGKVLKVGNGNSALGNNQFVLSAHGEAIASLKSLKVGTSVVLQPRQELAKVETAGGAMVEGGTLVLHNGSYVGPKDSTNRSRSFIGTTKDEKLVVATVDKHNASSVGVTLEEGANLLTSLGAINGFELSNQGSVDVEVDGHYTHKGNETPSTYEKILIIK
ncbi:MAG: phosphodiester glycosidase family protein [Veillonella sp.]|uniref:phosphodiester glycosidase family protein n=1 Tax=Veillonella sp. TaxID=1926307 RepID=UPI00291262A1|nr:phosphodiester glycosidase family protein [Veillonella sp.]MDU7715671.1 phosphodiester glycosidase family protein [Veillonella sp.]